ncbi:G-protein coupled receptor 161-like [Dendronephthya gigantea]|uniref:G-protein coupled receptor 161-like n=1 Tax=Dendronephthya gigantea TaxID=151771 RepID=UPI00106A6E23|nr:G-protein coupled receptor 161-like [Dendronephthya gigantea]
MNTSNISSNFSDQGYVRTRTIIAIQSSVMFALVLLSLVCNGLVAITFCKSRDLLSVTCNKFVLNMTLINVFTTVLVLPFVVASSVYDDWIFRLAWCQVSGFLLILLSSALLLTLAALSYDRYYFIVKPLRHPIHMSSTRAYIMIILIWLFSLFVALLPLLGWGKYGYQRAKLSCTVLWHLYSSGGYSKFFCVISIFMPLFIIIVSYFFILRAVHKQVRGGRLSLGSLISPSEYIQARNQQRAMATRAEHSRTKAWKALVLHVGTNLVCWVPYSVCILIENLRRRTDIIAYEIQTLSVFLAFSSVLWCPIIYAFRVKVVRREINTIIRRYLRISRNQVRPFNPDECSFVIETPAAFRNRSASQVTIKGYDDFLSTEIEQSCTLPSIPEHVEVPHNFRIVRNYLENSQPDTEMTELRTSSLPGQVE